MNNNNTQTNNFIMPQQRREKVKLTSENILNIQSSFKKFLDDFVDEKGRNDHEKSECKSGLNDWLVRIFSHLDGNVEITDNPDFNFNEPISTEEPLDESLKYQVEEKERELKLLMEKVVQKRTEKKQHITNFARDMVKLESRFARELTIETPENNDTTAEVAAAVPRDMEQTEKEYDESMQLLVGLEKDTAERKSQLGNIINRDLPVSE